MLLRRKLILLTMLVLCGGSLSVSGVYAWYLHSDGYRAWIEDGVAQFLRLPTEIRTIRTLSFDSLSAGSIRVWLPDRREQIFECDRAVWMSLETEPGDGFALELHDGSLVIGTENWRQADYRMVLESGLGQDFASLDLRQTALRNIDLAWKRKNVDLAARGVQGLAQFHEDGTGELEASAWWLNDYRVPDPIRIHSRFRTNGGLVIEQVALEVPELPLSALRLGKVLGRPITRGDFSGRVVYEEHEDEWRVNLAGRTKDLPLGDLTARLPGGPIDGRLDLVIDDAEIVNETIRALRFHGELQGLELAPIARLLAIGEFPGALNLTVHSGHFAENSVELLSLSGRAEGLSTEALTGLIGAGTITGRVSATLDAFQVVGNRIRGGELTVEVTPPEGRPGTIDQKLLRSVAGRWLGITLPDVLPERIEYTKLGFRCRIEGTQLRVFGLHGSEKKVILAVKLFGAELPLVVEPARPFDISGWLDLFHDRLSAFTAPPIRNLWPRTKPQ